jgi:transposase
MLRLEEWMDIQLLAKQGYSIREIARRSGHGRNTISRLLKEDSTGIYTRRYRPRASKLDPFKAYVQERSVSSGISAVRLHQEIVAQGYAGSVDMVRRYVRTLAPRRATAATVRYETPPGQQGQADWAWCGRLADGTPVYAFLLVLGFSRMLAVCLSTDMRLETLLRCHEAAFTALGGCPQTILYDNMSQVRRSRTMLNPLFVDFAEHWGFVPTTHRVRRPRTKGKVERMVDYLKEGFLRGRTFADLADMQAQLQHWLDHTANVRLHATTGRRPIELWRLEQPLLQPLTTPYRLATCLVRKVSAEGWVQVQGVRYSVPPTQVGRSVLVEVRAAQQRVVIRADQVILADHPLATTRGASVSDPAHLAALWQLSVEQNPPPPAWQLSVADTVTTRPLSLYDDLVS